MANEQQDKRVALVTGANQGIGQHVAEQLAANGYTVLVGSRNIGSGEKTAKQIGSDAHAIQLDVTDQASINATADRIRKEFGRLDLLVNNAGISHAGGPGRPLEEIIATSRASNADVNEVRAIFETNVFGVLALTQALLPILREAPEARIVNVSSGMGSLTLNADPTFPYRSGFGPGYGASKTALNAITLAFAMELEGTNIKVYATSPGFTATALNNFAGTDSIEEGSKNVVRVALEGDGPSGTFSGPTGPFPW